MKSIWIVGASTGIGEALAHKYVSAGWRVVISARSKDKLQAIAQQYTDGQIEVVPFDVTDVQQVKEAYQIVSKKDLPDTVILNAGIGIHVDAANFSREIFEKVYNVNVFGVVNCLEHILPAFIQHGAGHIAIVASVAGYRGMPGAFTYCSSKAAVINMVEGLRFDLASHNVDITVINPGFVKTPLTDKNDFPMPFLISAEKAAKYIYKGMQSRDFEITFPKRFTYMLKFMRLLPNRLYYWWMSFVSRQINW